MPAPKNPITPEEQHRRFVEKAKELECDDSPDAFMKRLKKVARAKPKSEPEAG
jgi:hypothetical protein